MDDKQLAEELENAAEALNKLLKQAYLSRVLVRVEVKTEQTSNGRVPTNHIIVHAYKSLEPWPKFAYVENDV